MQYFIKTYWRGLKRGKPKRRAFNNIVLCFLLNIKCVTLTGRTINEINKNI